MPRLVSGLPALYRRLLPSFFACVFLRQTCTLYLDPHCLSEASNGRAKISNAKGRVNYASRVIYAANIEPINILCLLFNPSLPMS